MGISPINGWFIIFSSEFKKQLYVKEIVVLLIMIYFKPFLHEYVVEYVE